MSRLKKFTIIVSLVAVVAFSFAGGCAASGRVAQPPASGVTTINEAWNIIFSDYVDQTRLDARALSRAAIEGMLKELNDPYTSYLDPENYKLSTSSLGGQFDGIGATVALREGKLTIIAPMPDSPAAKAGIKSGDVILEINGKSTEGLSLETAVLSIRGPRGTAVKLLVLHLDDPKPVEIEIIRARVEVVSVSYEMKEDIAYININHFSERTSAEVTVALQGTKGAKGIVLDLRSNPGGLLEAVIDVASHFLSEGIVVQVRSNQQQLTTREAKPSNTTTDLPVVVLTDNFSASGSEVLSGALQDHRRAVIAGTQTFGKGSVNVLRPLSDGSGIYITTARWLTPNGRLIEGKGIEPDIKLELKDEEAIRWAIDYLHGKR